MPENLSQMAQPAVDTLLPLDEDQLFNELGARLSTVTQDPTQGGNFALETMTEVGPFESMSDFKEVGKRFFDNLSLSAYNVVCAKGEGSEDVKQLLDKGANALAAGIAGVLVAQLGIAAAIAAAVAALIVKLFFDASTKTLCKTWEEHLPQQLVPSA